MKRIFNFLFFSLVLFGCVASSAAMKSETSLPAAEIVEQNYDGMLELAYEMDQERVHAIYVVVISEPEVITAKPPESID